MITRRRLVWMIARNAVLLGSPVVLIALIASSPRHLLFWAIVGAFAVAMIPFGGALAWLYGTSRKRPQNHNSH